MRRPTSAAERSPGRSAAQRTPATSPMSPVVIELSPDQFSHIVRTASDGGHIATLLSGLDQARATLAPDLDHSRLSLSLLCGLSILAALPADGGYIAITQLARQTGRTTSTTHRYVSTLLAVGLIERDPTTREYRLAL
jgi:hypothetical protein